MTPVRAKAFSPAWWTGVTFFAAGVALLIWVDWRIAAGVFLIAWSHNVEYH